MATYNKRGYKAPKPEVIEEVETVETYEGKSTTEDVFNSLDQSASRTEAWVAKNQKIIFSVVGAIALATVAYLAYDKMVVEPKENEAANDMFQAQQYFTQAVDSPVANDSLYNLALKGGEGKPGFLGIIENNSGTDAANIAEYFAGMSYLNMGKYKEAVNHLDNFKTKDEVLGATAKGAIGDAFAQTKDNEQALKYYTEAAKTSTDGLIAPRFLFKAGQTALLLKKKEEAHKFFVEIKDKYETSAEGNNIEAYIAMTE